MQCDTAMTPIHSCDVTPSEYFATGDGDFNVYFYLFTKANPTDPETLVDGDINSVRNSNFDSNNPTRIICHGWTDNNESQLYIVLRDKYLSRGNFNIITIDWGEAADDPDYIIAATKAKYAGRKVASMVKFLERNASLDPNNTYLIGASLGAQVAGFAGKDIQPRRIHTIFALDAAASLFAYRNPRYRLARGDAHYVESIHTSGLLLGIEHPVGDASFYPHYGRMQPGCNDSTTFCDHSRAVYYFAESLELPNKFYAIQCSTYDQIIEKKCKWTGRVAYMGGDPSNYGRNIRGVYFLPVNEKYPYAVGKFSPAN
ncbi:unnamed protein product [Hermetia illucens]|uniref:Lipase domain-containing protein n=2 Tax=Hermetia illucens TaxID=343691 RepID=A0A7R8YNU7_HERIL|nr:unnamed protein product [Hermetia illucens]